MFRKPAGTIERTASGILSENEKARFVVMTPPSSLRSRISCFFSASCFETSSKRRSRAESTASTDAGKLLHEPEGGCHKFMAA
jgi:hypothetical protein